MLLMLMPLAAYCLFDCFARRFDALPAATDYFRYCRFHIRYAAFSIVRRHDTF